MSYGRTETVAVVRIIASIGRFVSSISSIVSVPFFSRSSKWNSRGSRTSACYRDKLFNVLGERWTLVDGVASADISNRRRTRSRRSVSIRRSVSVRPVAVSVSFSNGQSQKAGKDYKGFHDSTLNADIEAKVLGLYRVSEID